MSTNKGTAWERKGCGAGWAAVNLDGVVLVFPPDAKAEGTPEERARAFAQTSGVNFGAPRVFEIDLIEHYRGSNCDCRPLRCERCREGHVHCQGIYGGMHRECDVCGWPDGPTWWVNPHLTALQAFRLTPTLPPSGGDHNDACASDEGKT